MSTEEEEIEYLRRFIQELMLQINSLKKKIAELELKANG